MTLSEIAEMVGKATELGGIFLSGSELLNIRATQIPGVLLQALYRGSGARNAIAALELLGSNRETFEGEDARKIVTLQGVAFIVLGILLQAGPYLWEAAVSLCHMLLPR